MPYFTPSEASRDERVRRLIGTTLVTAASDEEEISRFRHTMARSEKHSHTHATARERTCLFAPY